MACSPMFSFCIIFKKLQLFYFADSFVKFRNMNMRKLHRLQSLAVNIVPTLCFLLTLFFYVRQRKFYEAKLKSIGMNYHLLLTSWIQ